MSNDNLIVSVIGAGSWGTAIVSILSRNTDVHWWVRRESQINQITKKKRNTRYLPNCILNTDKINLTSNLNDAIDCSNLIIIATPSEYLSILFDEMSEKLSNKIVISAVKGVITKSNLTPQKYFLGLNSSIDYGVISGPCHAEEVAMNKKSYLTLSISNQKLEQYLTSIFSTNEINVKISNDVIGTELSAILKNVYALITGICFGLAYGDNFLAVLITASTNELKRVLFSLDQKERSISQSAYLGDLLVTCYSIHSRNRRFGTYIGKGYSVESTKSVMNMVAEGYNATHCLYHLLMENDFITNAPIILATYNILYLDADPKIEIENLSTILS
jgi:glycerol-3-phosphate dehydrogenase (NAD(P)+)